MSKGNERFGWVWRIFLYTLLVVVNYIVIQILAFLTGIDFYIILGVFTALGAIWYLIELRRQRRNEELEEIFPDLEKIQADEPTLEQISDEQWNEELEEIFPDLADEPTLEQISDEQWEVMIKAAEQGVTSLTQEEREWLAERQQAIWERDSVAGRGEAIQAALSTFLEREKQESLEREKQEREDKERVLRIMKTRGIKGTKEEVKKIEEELMKNRKKIREWKAINEMKRKRGDPHFGIALKLDKRGNRLPDGEKQ